MPYPTLFMAAASTGSSTNTIAGVVVTLASITAIIGGYMKCSAATEEERNNKIARERARHDRYERDRYIREHTNETAQFANSETPLLIAAFQERQRQFSELITHLSQTLHQGEQGNEALKMLIPLMESHLQEMTLLTAKFTSELPTSQQNLVRLTTQLSATGRAFASNQKELSRVLDDIGEASSQLRRTAERVQHRSAVDPAQETVLLKQQNRDYKQYIEQLSQRVEEQSKIIQSLKAKLEGKHRSNWTNGRVFKISAKESAPTSSASSPGYEKK